MKLLQGVALALVVIVVFLMPSHCGLTKRYAALKADHDALLINYDKLKGESSAEIAKLEAIKAARDLEIAAANAEISRKNAALKAKDKTIADLEAGYADLPDDAARIANLEAQVAAWKEKFSIAEGIIAEKDAIIFSLTGKYEAQVKISADYKALWEGADKLYQAQAAMNKELEGIVKRNALLSKGKNILIVAAAGVLTYTLIRGK